MKYKDQILLEAQYDKIQAFKQFANKELNVLDHVKKLTIDEYENSSMGVPRELYMSILPEYLDHVKRNIELNPINVDFYYDHLSSREIQQEYEGFLHQALYDKATKDTLENYGGYEKFKKNWSEDLTEELGSKAYDYLTTFYNEPDYNDFLDYFTASTRWYGP
jgi:hypothetical protein